MVLGDRFGLVYLMKRCVLKDTVGKYCENKENLLKNIKKCLVDVCV